MEYIVSIRRCEPGASKACQIQACTRKNTVFCTENTLTTWLFVGPWSTERWEAAYGSQGTPCTSCSARASPDLPSGGLCIQKMSFSTCKSLFLTVKHTFEHLPANRFLNFLVPFLSPGILHKVLPFVRGSANFHFFLRVTLGIASMPHAKEAKFLGLIFWLS